MVFQGCGGGLPWQTRTTGCVLLLFAREEGGSDVEIVKHLSSFSDCSVLAAYLPSVPVSVHVTAFERDSQPEDVFLLV